MNQGHFLPSTDEEHIPRVPKTDIVRWCSKVLIATKLLGHSSGKRRRNTSPRTIASRSSTKTKKKFKSALRFDGNSPETSPNYLRDTTNRHGHGYEDYDSRKVSSVGLRRVETEERS